MFERSGMNNGTDAFILLFADDTRLHRDVNGLADSNSAELDENFPFLIHN